MKGRFIVFEGIDGSGKSTQARRLADHLRGLNRPVTPLREPGDTPLGERIRTILLDPETGQIDPAAEALLYSAARAQIVADRIRPAIARGETVILDRYDYSTAAYQGAGLGLFPTDILETGNIYRFPRPDRVYLFDLEPETALKRLPAGPDRIEARGIDYFRKVRKGFLALAARESARFRILDAGRPPDEIFRELLALETGDP